MSVDCRIRSLERAALQGDSRAQERLNRLRASATDRWTQYRNWDGEWTPIPPDRLKGAKRVGPFQVRRYGVDPDHPWTRRDGYAVCHVGSGCIALKGFRKRSTAIKVAQTLVGLAPTAAWGIHDQRHGLEHLTPVIKALAFAARQSEG